MNVLLVNPVRPLSFWSFRVSCSWNGRGALLPPLGLITVASLLPKEWQLRLVDLNCREITEEDWDWADTIMLSAILVQKPSFLAVAKEAKKRGKQVVAGGPWVTTMSDEALAAGADYVVRGEAENTVALLISEMKKGKKGRVVQADGKPDLISSPVPRYDLLNFGDYLALSLQTSRGCPFDCEFCDVVSIFGRGTRYKTPEQVITELDTMYQLGWRGETFITDDNFIGSRKHSRAIVEKIAQWNKDHGSRFTFHTQTSVDLGQDKEMIDLMTHARFGKVIVGLESPDTEVLERIGKKQNVRNPLVESVNNISRNGLTIIGNFIIGFDGERPGVGERISSFVEAAAIPLVYINTLHVLPGTKLWKRLEKENRLLPSKTCGETTAGRLNFVPERPETEIMSEYAAVWDFIYDRSRSMGRAYRHILEMRPTRRAMRKMKGEPEEEAQSSRWSSGKPLGRDLILFLRLIWCQGILASSRLQFWRQLISVYLRNPSRLVQYLELCGISENMYGLIELVRERTDSAEEAPTSNPKHL